jgi:flagellin-like protein
MRGISPLIATIMLIAFSLVVSGIFYAWISQFSYSEREEFQVCSKAQIILQKAYYNAESGNINLVVYNTGSVPLTGFVVLISSEQETKTNKDFLKKKVEANDIGLFPVRQETGIKSMVVQSVECRNAQDMVSVYDVEGL